MKYGTGLTTTKMTGTCPTLPHDKDGNIERVKEL